MINSAIKTVISRFIMSWVIAWIFTMTQRTSAPVAINRAQIKAKHQTSISNASITGTMFHGRGVDTQNSNTNAAESNKHRTNASDRKRIRENLVSLIKIASIQLSITFNCSWHAETPPRCFLLITSDGGSSDGIDLSLRYFNCWHMKVCNFVEFRAQRR